MKNDTITVRITEAQSKQIDELQSMGFGGISDIIRTALDRMYSIEKRREAYKDNPPKDFDIVEYLNEQ